jgi:hypothetical protein
MGLIDRILEDLETRRQNILHGRINCIPSPFKRFSNDFVGIEKGQYYLVTANQKAGKTQLTNFIFVYNTLLYAFEHKDQIRLKIFYYPLEETKENITLRFIAYLLYVYSNGTIILSSKDLRSTRKDYPLSNEILLLLKQSPYKEILEFYEQVVEFREEKNPTGIMKSIEEYYLTHGRIHKKIQTIVDKITGEEEIVEAFDYYEPNDEDEYVLALVDHISLLNTESGLTIKGTIDLMSSYFVRLRNRYNLSPVVVQQQAAAQESIDNFKLHKLRPSSEGLADSKYCSRDASIMLGLFSPARHEIQEYYGYDIRRLKNNIRFLEVCVNREGDQNGLCPLYFNGAVNYFEELPLPTDPAINKFYEKVRTVNLLIKKQTDILRRLYDRITNRKKKS